MQSTPSSNLAPKLVDDPCDDVEIAPDEVRVAPSDEELASLLHQAARYRSAQARTVPDVTVDRAAPPINPMSVGDQRGSEEPPIHTTAPVVDVMSRPVPANDERGAGVRRSLLKHATRIVVALVLAGCVALTAASWKSYGAAATKLMAKLATQVVVGSAETDTPAPQPAIRAEAATATSEQPAAAAQAAAAPSAVAPAPPSADTGQSIESLTHDVAALTQEIEALKADLEQLKASQQQMLREAAKASEQTVRPRAAAPSPKSAAAPMRKPTQLATTPQGIAPPTALPPAAPPYYAPPQRYVPPQPEPLPQATAEPPVQTEWVPRPPMPVR